MLISNIIATYLPIPMPSSVIGLVILFSLLCLKVIKLEQVESLGTALTGIIDSYSSHQVFQLLILLV